MVTSTEKLPSSGASEVKLIGNAGFGAYGNGIAVHPGLKLAIDPAATQPDDSVAFADSDKRWLKELGITTTNPKDFDKAWQPDHVRNRPRRWAESYGGRLAIRSVSRGVVGAAFFAAGSIFSRNAMSGYNPNSSFSDLPEKLAYRPLQVIAKLLDRTVGRGIFEATKLVTNEETARKAITFRETRAYGYTAGNFGGFKSAESGALYGQIVGRSLGHEAMAITFDFATMSFGDYMTRYTLGFFDPNAKIKWLKDGKIDFPAALKDVLHNVWTGITYASGEDMAVAIPYVYGLRLQRNLIEKASPGFKYDSDHSLNGGSFKVQAFDAEGRTIGKGNGAELESRNFGVNTGQKAKTVRITGDYQLEGMLDLMGRFSWYNVGTKMFRDTYSHLSIAANHWLGGDRRVGLPSVNAVAFTPAKLLDTATTFVRYVARTTIKVMMYMLPATFFFYMARAPQSKFIGMAIHPEMGPLGMKGGSNWLSIQADVASLRKESGSKKTLDDSTTLSFQQAPDQKVNNPFHTRKEGHENRFEMYSNKMYGAETKAPWYNIITNPIGKFCYNTGSAVNQILQPARKFNVSGDAINEFSRKWMNASLAYTPYFMSKTDIGSTMWDTKRTDMGIDRFLGGIAHFKWSEFSGGFSEVYRSLLGQPFADPGRELLAKEAMKRDEEISSNEGFQLVRGRGGNRNPNDNSDEARNGQNNSSRIFATEDKKETRPTLTALRNSMAAKPREASWALQEAANKLETDSRNQTIH